MNKVLVAGFGFVGKAYAQYMREIGQDVTVYAKPEETELIQSYGFKLPKDGEKFDCGIICLPTPTINGKCSTAIVEDVLTNKLQQKYDIDMYLLKSTVEIGTTRKLEEKIKKQVVFYPEFLEARTPLGGVLNQKMAVFGSNTLLSEDKQKQLLSVAFGQDTKPRDTEIFFTDSETAESIKLIHNMWLACNISFWNSIVHNSQIVNKKVNIQTALEAIHCSPYFGKHPWAVGKAYGGACLPKDIQGFIGASDPKKDGVFLDFLKKIEEVNQNVK
jgi:UDPglucose 6-dehydrogenase